MVRRFALQDLVDDRSKNGVFRVNRALFRDEHELVRVDGQWKVASKIIQRMNDAAPNMLDVYGA
jgi:hypothetical protein